jgi:mRNA-degrading endonuclease RelE of RelBE toxin-antitoxin system
MSYQGFYTARFSKRNHAYRSLSSRIKDVVTEVLTNPYAGTEILGKKGKLNLKGCRSARVGMNVRIIFVICEECRGEPESEYCFCEGLPRQTVVFLTVGPHDRAYTMK